MDVQIKEGVVTLKKPTAGERNKAIMKAETADGIKNTVMMVELLPMCIVKHPFGMGQPIATYLDALTIEDYDLLVNGLATLMKPPEGDVAKKSSKPSE